VVGLLGALAGLLAAACALLTRRIRRLDPPASEYSRVRLDPLGSVLELRGYPVRVDVRAPLADMAMPYGVSGNVTIAGDVASVTKVNGQIGREAYRDFCRALRARGVRRVVWERHKPWGAIHHVTRFI